MENSGEMSGESHATVHLSHNRQSRHRDNIFKMVKVDAPKSQQIGQLLALIMSRDDFQPPLCARCTS